MPISGGTAGAHDDNMHQGSAKRDVADGVAAINPSGYLLSVGSILMLAKGVGTRISIYERSSGEPALELDRLSAQTYKLYLNTGSAWTEVLHAVMKDAVNGVAALDAGGAVVAPGSEVKLTRDGSENIEVVERTSGDIVYRWTRVGVNDYECRINCGGVACIILNDSMKDIAGGIAGLDANMLLDPVVHAVGLEEYSNHLGAVDNFTQTGTAGTGSANTDAANHEMDLSCGNNVGHARFETKDAWTVGTKPTIINMLIQNIVDNVNGTCVSFIGCKADLSATSVLNSMGFRQIADNTWQTVSGDAASDENNAITALANGDLVSILATSSAIRFFVNGSLVQTHTTRIPGVGVKMGGSAECTFGVPTTARQISIDMMSERRYL